MFEDVLHCALNSIIDLSMDICTVPILYLFGRLQQRGKRKEEGTEREIGSERTESH